MKRIFFLLLGLAGLLAVSATAQTDSTATKADSTSVVKKVKFRGRPNFTPDLRIGLAVPASGVSGFAGLVDSQRPLEVVAFGNDSAMVIRTLIGMRVFHTAFFAGAEVEALSIYGANTPAADKGWTFRFAGRVSSKAYLFNDGGALKGWASVGPVFALRANKLEIVRPISLRLGAEYTFAGPWWVRVEVGGAETAVGIAGGFRFGGEAKK